MARHGKTMRRHKKRRQTRRKQKGGDNQYCANKTTQSECTSTTCGENTKCSWVLGGMGETSKCQCPPSSGPRKSNY